MGKGVTKGKKEQKSLPKLEFCGGSLGGSPAALVPALLGELATSQWPPQKEKRRADGRRTDLDNPAMSKTDRTIQQAQAEVERAQADGCLTAWGFIPEGRFLHEQMGRATTAQHTVHDHQSSTISPTMHAPTYQPQGGWPAQIALQQASMQ